MTFREILVPLVDAEYGNSAIEAALALLHQPGSRITGAYARTDPRAAIPYIGEGMTADVIQELCNAAERDGLRKAAAARKLFEAACEKHGVGDSAGAGPQARWLERVGDAVQVMAAEARVADLSVIGRPGGDHANDLRAIVEGLLFRSGRPVLIVPPGCRPAIGTVNIAWNGSAEASRAVALAMPLLRAAKNVHITAVGKVGDGCPDTAALAAYLGRYGIEASQHGIEDSEGDFGQTLLKASRDCGADVLIIGAYSHSRWREMILGGVTRLMIEESDIPVFAVH